MAAVRGLCGPRGHRLLQEVGPPGVERDPGDPGDPGGSSSGSTFGNAKRERGEADELAAHDGIFWELR